MKKERIEHLFKHHATAYYDCGCDAEYCDCEPDRRMYLGNFTQAINQAEKENKLEWYKKLKNRLNKMATECNIVADIFDYQLEIQNKIKELEDEN